MSAILSSAVAVTAAANGILCLTFDDSRFADWEAALPIFAAHGAHATFFAYHGIDENAVASLRKLSEAGHSIGLHGLKHQVAPDAVAKLGEEGYLADEIEPQLAACRAAGLHVRSFAYPMSRHTPQTDALLLRHFDRLRGGGDFSGAFPAAEAASRRYLPGLGVGPKYKRGGAEVAAMLPGVAASNAVLVLYSHGIGETAEGVSTSRADLETVLSAAESLGMAILGFDELDRMCAAPALRWSCSENARIAGGRLVVDVPAGEEAKGGLASAEIDLSPWDGRPVGAEIAALGKGIGRPLHWYNGLKFQFEYEDPVAGDWFYPNTPSRRGDFPAQTIRLGDFGAATRRKARIVLGLQEASGHAEFDLSSLRLVDPVPPWPVTNQTHRCEYTVLFNAEAQRRGETKGKDLAQSPRSPQSHLDANEQLRGDSQSGNPVNHVSEKTSRTLRTSRDENLCPSAPLRLCVENLRGVMSPHRMTEDDFDTLESWGATLVRYQMWGYRQEKDAPVDFAAYDRWLAEKLDHFDSFVLPQAVKRGMMVVLDLHTPPGGRDAANDLRMCHDAECADFFVETWRRIAARFRGRDGIYGYDLVNEPMQTSEALPGCDFWTLQKRAAEAIREIDPDVSIVVEANSQDSPSAFATLSPLDLANVIYEVHMYVPLRFTHQGVMWKPGKTPDPYPNAEKGWSAETLRGALKPVRDFQLRHGAKIYCGEFSAIAWAPGADRYLRDCIAIFEEYGWDWTYHAFREWPGWSVEHEGTGADSLVPAPAGTPRKTALLEGLRR